MIRTSYKDSGALTYICRLWPFLPLRDFEFDFVTFLKALVPFGCDGAIVHKYIGTIFTSDEPVAFCIIEPLDRAFHFPLTPFSPRLKAGADRRD